MSNPTIRQLAESTARTLFRHLPGWRTRPPTHGEVQLVAETLLEFRNVRRLERRKIGKAG